MTRSPSAPLAIAACVLATGCELPAPMIDARLQHTSDRALHAVIHKKNVQIASLHNGVLIFERQQSGFLFIDDAGRASTFEGPMISAASESKREADVIWGTFPYDLFTSVWDPDLRGMQLLRVRGGSTREEGLFERVIGVVPIDERKLVGLAKDHGGWKRIVWDGEERSVVPLPRYARKVRMAGASILSRGETEDVCVEEELAPFDIAGSREGEVLVLGESCSADIDAERRDLVVDRWTDLGEKHEIEPIATISRYVLGKLCVSKFGGEHVSISGWQETTIATKRKDEWVMSPPLDGSNGRWVASCAAAADGSVWVSLAGNWPPHSVYRLSMSGEWTEVQMPESDVPWCFPSEVVATASGSVWVRSGKSRACNVEGNASRAPDEHFLLRTGPVTGVLAEALAKFQRLGPLPESPTPRVEIQEDPVD